MPGIWFCSLFILLNLAAAAPQRGDGIDARLRNHEIQLRHNGYAGAPSSAILKENGFTKVILRVFSDDEKNGGLYFNNNAFKPVRPVLDAWAPKFNDEKVGLWAWMGGRWFSWFHDSRYLDREWQNGQRLVIPKLDLFNPDAEKVILSLFRQLAAKPIPGILIQDDLVLRHNEGFSNWGRAYFTVATGLIADENLMVQKGSAHNQAWQRLKCERVTRFVEKIVQTCKGVNPQIRIGMNIHYEMPLAPELACSWYAHDRQALVESSLDHFYLMAYHRQIKSELGLDEDANRIYFTKMISAALEIFGPRLVVKIQVRDWRNSNLIPMVELRTYYDLIPAGVERVCFAAVDPDDIPLIARIFSK